MDTTSETRVPSVNGFVHFTRVELDYMVKINSLKHLLICCFRCSRRSSVVWCEPLEKMPSVDTYLKKLGQQAPKSLPINKLMNIIFCQSHVLHHIHTYRCLHLLHFYAGIYPYCWIWNPHSQGGWSGKTSQISDLNSWNLSLFISKKCCIFWYNKKEVDASPYNIYICVCP